MLPVIKSTHVHIPNGTQVTLRSNSEHAFLAMVVK